MTEQAPNFSPGNPYWWPEIGRNSKAHFLYAIQWELRKSSPLWRWDADKDEGGGVLALRIRFYRGAMWKALWMNQLKHSLRFGAKKLLKDQRAREAGILEALALGSGLPESIAASA